MPPQPVIRTFSYAMTKPPHVRSVARPESAGDYSSPYLSRFPRSPLIVHSPNRQTGSRKRTPRRRWNRVMQVARPSGLGRALPAYRETHWLNIALLWFDSGNPIGIRERPYFENFK